MGSGGRTKLAIYERQYAGAVRPVFVWNERYNTGLAEVDEQHRRLVDILNHVDRLLRAESPLDVLEPVLDELTEYAKYHFGTEERLMDELRCEPAHVERHKAAHGDFARQVALMRTQAAVLAAGAPQGTGAAQDVLDAVLFTSRNLETVRDCVGDLFRVIEEYEKVRAPSARTAGDAAREARDAEVLERLRRIVFEMLEESRTRLTQAEEILRSPPRR